MLPKTPPPAGPRPPAHTAPHTLLRVRPAAAPARTLAEAGSRLPGPADRRLRPVAPAPAGAGTTTDPAAPGAPGGTAERLTTGVRP
ncbi:hypothetical protein [Streptomyces sp. NPDC048606]|uniref:hypothetical protein n=1 Tax=Streptomyces sp. NPDC048606 TaxID=3154726 RepID=UPI003420E775